MKPSFVAELKRRNVFRMAGLYLVAAWLITQVASTVLPMFGTPEWLPRTIVIVLAIGFVPAIVFAWVFELTPEGLKRETEVAPADSIAPATGRRLDRAIIGVLAIALACFAFDRFVLAPRREAALRRETSDAVSVARKQAGIDAIVRAYGDRSIAVLPFLNMSADKDQDYFADGISEELVNRLAKIHDLRVIARTSSFAFKGKDVGVAEIASRLDVAHVLEGSVRKSGNTVRITAQLIRAADSAHLWSETYDRAVTNAFAVQDEIAAAVVSELKLSLLGAPPPRKIDAKAETLFVQARQLGRLHTAAGYDRAEALLDEAVGIDPAFAAAWDQLAFLYEARTGQQMLPEDEGYARALTFIEKALAADPEFAPSLARRGEIAADRNDLATAAREVERALALDPQSPIVLAVASTILYYLERVEDSLAISEWLAANDPINPITLTNLASSYVAAGRYDDAIATANTVLTLTPGRESAQTMLITSLLMTGRGDAASEAIGKLDDADERRKLGAMADHVRGKQAQSDRALAEMIDAYAHLTDASERNTAAFDIAELAAFRGENARAFEWLEKWHVDERSFGALPDAFLISLRADPRWSAFARRIGRAPDQLAAIKLDVTLPEAVAPADGAASGKR